MEDQSRENAANEQSPLISSSRVRPHLLLSTSQKIQSAVLLLVSGLISIMCTHFIGPTLLDLQLITNTSLYQVSWYKSALSAGNAAGTSVAGLSLSRGGAWSQMALNCALGGVSIALIPLMTNYFAAMAAILIAGVFSGFTLNGMITLMLKVWKDSEYQGVLILLTAASMSAGVALSPILAAPFLSPQIVDNMTQMSNIITHYVDTSTNNMTVILDANIKNDNQVWIAYTIGGIMYGVCGIGFVLLQCQQGCCQESKSSHAEVNASNKVTIKPRASTKLSKWEIMMNCCALMIFFLDGSFLLIPHNFMVPYTSSFYSWPASKGAQLQTVIGITGALGTFLYMPLIKYFSIDLIIAITLVIQVINNTLLVLLMDTYADYTWVYCCILGFIGQQIYIPLIIWIEKFFAFRGFVTALPLVGISLCNISLSPLVGYFLDNDMFKASFVMSLGSVLMCLIVFGIMQIPKRGKQREIVTVVTDESISLKG